MTTGLIMSIKALSKYFSFHSMIKGKELFSIQPSITFSIICSEDIILGNV